MRFSLHCADYDSRLIGKDRKSLGLILVHAVSCNSGCSMILGQLWQSVSRLVSIYIVWCMVYCGTGRDVILAPAVFGVFDDAGTVAARSTSFSSYNGVYSVCYTVDVYLACWRHIIIRWGYRPADFPETLAVYICFFLFFPQDDLRLEL